MMGQPCEFQVEGAGPGAAAGPAALDLGERPGGLLKQVRCARSRRPIRQPARPDPQAVEGRVMEERVEGRAMRAAPQAMAALGRARKAGSGDECAWHELVALSRLRAAAALAPADWDGQLWKALRAALAMGDEVIA